MRLFRIHLAGVAGSNLADGLLAGALPLIAITLTRDPLLISLVTAAFWTPWLLTALLVGVVVDRGDRALIRRRALAGRLALLLAALGLAAVDAVTIEVLVVLVLLYAVTEVFSDLAAGALVPQLVERDDLPTANGRIMGTERLMQEFVGAPLGGVLVALGSAWVFGASAGLLVVVVLLLARLRRPEGFRAAPEGTSAPHAATPVRVTADIAYGLRALLAHPVVRPLTIGAGLTNLVNTAYFAVFVLWVVGPQSQVGLEPWQFPLLLIPVTAGALVASVLPTRWLGRLGEVRVALGSWLVNALLLLVPVLAPTWPAIAAAFVVVGFTNMVGNVIWMSIRQRVVPAGLLGRIGGASRTVSFGTMALGAPLGGLIAAQWGLPALFVGMSVGAVLVALWLATQVDQATVDAAELRTLGPRASATAPASATG
ncbi:MFS transporter [Nostocoides sp. F2B08]|uniref:MFS transporter n=1 Tax=Nostocoides sp. F2B08 TaxID=2653936 RepID=UPI001263502B|nr:MFS transporter [Tetrasphaera sp. F2B08]KAB7741396.1 MFS transporter [Tetrasphaera sp. F2B08]